MSKYRFDQIAFNSTEKKKPTDEDKYTYIGLEHLDSGSLQIMRYGSDVAPIGEKLVMREGDVLFGKRRAYQKKVGIAPFDGIFSAHGMVLRPREDVVDKDFFPLFISSDYFLDAAIKISVGSLSPTINWSDLKVLEFELPDLEKQKELAKVLWAMDATKRSYQKLLQKTDELVKARFVEMFGDPTTNPRRWTIKKLSEISEYFIGLTYQPQNVVTDGLIVLRSGNIQNSKLSLEDIVRVNVDVKDKLLVRQNDILMCSRNGSADLVGKVAKISELKEKMTFVTFMTIIRSDYCDYLFAFFQQDAFRRQLTESKTATVNQITKSMLDKVEVALPPMEIQEQFARFVYLSAKSKVELEIAFNELNSVYKKIIAENLG